MAPFKFTQVAWKWHLIVIVVPVVLFRGMQDNFEWGLTLIFAIALGVLLAIIINRFFKSVVEFRDSSLIINNGYFSKTEEIPYTKLEKLTYFNATRFLKLNIYLGGNKIELPPPTRLAQTKELFAWLQVKNPAIAFEIIQTKTSPN